jgi:hypothetical protein
MSPLSLTPVLGVPLQAFADMEVEHTSITVHLRGTANLLAKDRLDVFLTGVHREALRLHVNEVAVDFRKLEFMNSSCFKGFLDWITHVQESPLDQIYKIGFLSTAGILWQRRSLRALQCFAPDLIEVED